MRREEQRGLVSVFIVVSELDKLVPFFSASLMFEASLIGALVILVCLRYEKLGKEIRCLEGMEFYFVRFLVLL